MCCLKRRNIFILFQFLLILCFIFSSIGETFYSSVNTNTQYIIVLFSFYYLFSILCCRGVYPDQLIILLYAILLSFFMTYLSSRGNINMLKINYIYIYPIFLGYLLSYRFENGFVLRVLQVCLIANFLAICYEIINLKYVVKLSEDAIGINNLIYRNGLFSNPKEGGAFIACVALIMFKYGKYSIVAASFLFSILCGVRTSSFILFFPFLVVMYSFLKRGLVSLSWMLLLFLLVGYYMFYYMSDVSSLMERFINLLSTTDEGNSMRLVFMKKHVDICVDDYNLFDYLFGRFGYSRNQIGNGAESSWLDLLTNVGISTFLLYVIPLCQIIVRSQKWIMKITYLVLFVSMGISRFGIGITSGVLFWLLIFQELKESKLSKDIS